MFGNYWQINNEKHPKCLLIIIVIIYLIMISPIKMHEEDIFEEVVGNCHLTIAVTYSRENNWNC